MRPICPKPYIYLLSKTIWDTYGSKPIWDTCRHPYYIAYGKFMSPIWGTFPCVYIPLNRPYTWIARCYLWMVLSMSKKFTPSYRPWKRNKTLVGVYTMSRKFTPSYRPWKHNKALVGVYTMSKKIPPGLLRLLKCNRTFVGSSSYV